MDALFHLKISFANFQYEHGKDSHQQPARDQCKIKIFLKILKIAVSYRFTKFKSWEEIARKFIPGKLQWMHS